MSNDDAQINPDFAAQGLTAAEVQSSRARHGENILTPPSRDPWWILYLGKFRDPIIRILMVAAFVALAVGIYDGHYIEGIGIVIAILLATSLAFINEFQAAKEFDILNKMADEETLPVIRDSRHQTVPKRELVVGDIVLTEQGAEIPADAQVLSSVAFSVNESSLTGESLPVAKFAKKAADSPADTALAYPRHIVLRGTTVADGHALLQVTAVGDATEIGKTARAASESTAGLTPLGKQLEKLAGVISIGAFAAAAVIFIAQIIRGAANGEIYDQTEKAGSLINIPLNAGQWYCFALLAVALLVLCSQMWIPTIRDGLKSCGYQKWFPKWLEFNGHKGFFGLFGIAAAVWIGGIAAGWLAGAISMRYGDWMPLPALKAFLSYFMVAVTVIVVAVPEGLPMCVTLALAYSMKKMTAAKNLVRKMHACETIGAASVICSDKTGTLTMNEMRVHKPLFHCIVDNALPATGTGADRLAEAVSANSTANIERRDGQALPIGNPTEAALLLWLDGNGRNYQTVRTAFAVRRQLTFTTERKFMATAGISAIDNQPVLYVKGAAEIVLSRCNAMRDLSGSEILLDAAMRQGILAEAALYQNRGMRIIGMARRQVDAAYLENELDADGIGGLIWDGCFAIADPIRPDVPAAINDALGAGIKVKVVTGDNQATAREIARQAGLWKEEDNDTNIITGDAFEALDDAEAALAASRIKVMSRARPLHKLRLVKLLQSQQEIVAVTGDGTNDAPALNHADVGLAMGKTGTSVAKEAADIILLDDSFKSIVNAVAWGRSLYANIQKFVIFQLTINVTAVGIALLGPFLGVSLPLTVTQMLWVNLIMDTFAALALASEPPEYSLLKNPPRPPNAFIITRPMKHFILGVGSVFLALFLIVILGFKAIFPLDPATEAGRHNLTLFFTSFVALQFWNLFNARAFGTSHSAFANLRNSKGFLAMAAAIVVGQYLLVTYGGEMFRVNALSAQEWLSIIVLTSPVLWIGEIWRLQKRTREQPGYWRYS